MIQTGTGVAKVVGVRLTVGHICGSPEIGIVSETVAAAGIVVARRPCIEAGGVVGTLHRSHSAGGACTAVPACCGCQRLADIWQILVVANVLVLAAHKGF